MYPWMTMRSKQAQPSTMSRQQTTGYLSAFTSPPVLFTLARVGKRSGLRMQTLLGQPALQGPQVHNDN